MITLHRNVKKNCYVNTKKCGLDTEFDRETKVKDKLLRALPIVSQP